MEHNITSKFDGGTWHVKLQGEVDIYNAAEIKKGLHELLDEHNADMSIDCLKLEYIDSTGLGALVAVLKKVKEANNKMYLTNVKPAALKLFEITDLDKVFIINEVN